MKQVLTIEDIEVNAQWDEIFDGDNPEDYINKFNQENPTTPRRILNSKPFEESTYVAPVIETPQEDQYDDEDDENDEDDED